MDLDPLTGEQLREVIRYEHDRAGGLIHVDVEKLSSLSRTSCNQGPETHN